MLSKAVITAQYLAQVMDSLMNCTANSKLQLNAKVNILLLHYHFCLFLHSPFDLYVIQTLVGMFKTLCEGDGGDKPITRTWTLQPNLANFEERFDKKQEELDSMCGGDDFITGNNWNYAH